MRAVFGIVGCCVICRPLPQCAIAQAPLSDKSRLITLLRQSAHDLLVSASGAFDGEQVPVVAIWFDHHQAHLVIALWATKQMQAFESTPSLTRIEQEPLQALDELVAASYVSPRPGHPLVIGAYCCVGCLARTSLSIGGAHQAVSDVIAKSLEHRGPPTGLETGHIRDPQ